MRITVQNRFISCVALVISVTTLLTLVKNASIILEFNDRLTQVEQNIVSGTLQKQLDITSLSLIPPELTKAIIIIESNGDPKAYNTSTGAVGLMQITPIVYKKVCGLTKEEAFLPHKNIACGTLFMKHLLEKYKGNIEKALQFYNNGHIVRNKKYAPKVIKEMTK